MHHPSTRSLIATVLLLGCGTTITAQGGPPRGLPPLRVPTANPISTAKINLGKALFFEEQLSATKTVACATCHLPEAGGGDPRTGTARHPGFDGTFGTADDVFGSPGVIANLANGEYTRQQPFGLRPQVTGRKAPPTIMAAFNREQFWDGRATPTFTDPVSGAALFGAGSSLEQQASEPPLSTVEMAHAGENWTALAAEIAGARPLALASNLPPALESWIGSRDYPALFFEAFGSTAVTPVRILQAIATYQRTLIADGAPFDAFLAGQPGALTPQEQRGLQVFRGAARCDTCHSGPLLTNQQYFNIGVRPAFEDPGRGAITGDPADQGAFKVQGLRNIALRAPYFHNGRMPTLQAVVRFYRRGGDFQQGQTTLIQPFRISPQEEADLLAFLTNALTDPRVAAGLPPFDRPTLFSESSRAPTAYGFGAAGSNGRVPAMIAPEPPLLGSTRFTMAIEGAAPGSAAVLLLDLARGNGAPIAGIPAWVAGSPALGVAPLGALAGGGPGGAWISWSTALPTDPALATRQLFTQAAILDPGMPGGLASTAGLEIRWLAPR